MKKMDGTYTNMDFAYGITVDKRNQAFKPTDGYRTKFVQSLPLIMDSSALLNGFDVSAYHSFSEDVIGAAKFYARSIHGLNNEDVRLTSMGACQSSSAILTASLSRVNPALLISISIEPPSALEACSGN